MEYAREKAQETAEKGSSAAESAKEKAQETAEKGSSAARSTGEEASEASKSNVEKIRDRQRLQTRL